METITVAFIVTVLNEEESIDDFLNSLANQTRLPDEIVLVDGGSTDSTVPTINKIFNQHPILRKVEHKVMVKKGNRSVGRNEAVKHSESTIIAISDAGCILDSRWIEKITEPFIKNSHVDVVAGYYNGYSETDLQKAVIPYVLVMPDRLDPDTFLPASRSMALKKSVFEKVGGFPEEFSHNEDYVFARKLKKDNKLIYAQKSAVVTWVPPRSLKKIYTMIYRFAYGDVQAGILRPKVVFLLLRYLLILGIVVYMILTGTWQLIFVMVCLFTVYIVWSIWKSYRYVVSVKGRIYLPVMQLTSDCAVIHGTLLGGIQYLWGTLKK